MEGVAEGQTLPASLRERIEQALAEAGDRIGFDMTKGNVRVTIALEDGNVRWVEPTHLRVPVSRFEQLAGEG